MRIWYQSSLDVEANPVFKPYQKSLERNAAEAARPGNVVDVHGVRQTKSYFSRSAYARYLNATGVVSNAIRAEAEGYDAVAIGCYADPCLLEIRDSVGIPTVFIMQTSMHFACMLGDKFALVGYSPPNLTRMRRLAERYGLAARVAASGCFQADLQRADEWFEDPKPLIEEFTREAAVCVEKGADVLIPCCGIVNQVLRNNGVRSVNGALVLDGSTLLIKITEAMAEVHKLTGLTTRNPHVTADVLRKIQADSMPAR